MVGADNEKYNTILPKGTVFRFKRRASDSNYYIVLNLNVWDRRNDGEFFGAQYTKCDANGFRDKGAVPNPYFGVNLSRIEIVKRPSVKPTIPMRGVR